MNSEKTIKNGIQQRVWRSAVLLPNFKVGFV
jgi:hypothetical protein